MEDIKCPVEEQLVHRLLARGFHIACAESCTGGLVASRLISIAGASEVLNVSFITYSNEAKVKYLSVKPETIDTYCVVSEEVAAEMAVGAANTADAEVGISVTGFAGPDGGTEENPVGTVCFGCAINGVITTRRMQFGNPGRNEVREKSAQFALEFALSCLG